MSQTQRKTEKPITAAQIKRIHTIVHILNISDDNYLAALDSRFNVTSCKDLTIKQAGAFIDELEKLASQVQVERYQAQREEAKQKAEAEKPKRFDNLASRPGRRLIALDSIMKRKGYNRIGLGKTDEMLIPAFNLKSHEDSASNSARSTPGCLGHATLRHCRR